MRPFFTATNLFFVKVLNDLLQKFFTAYLRKVDCSAALVPEIFQTVKNTASKLLCIETPTADKFLKRLKFDDKGNVSSKNVTYPSKKKPL